MKMMLIYFIKPNLREKSFVNVAHMVKDLIVILTKTF